MANKPKYNPETVKSILNVLQKESEAEEGRLRFITSKVQMMLTLSGILLTAIIFLFKTVIEENYYKKLSSGLLSLAMLTIISAATLFLNVIKIKAFRRIKSEALAFNAELEKSPVDVESRLITTYYETLEANRPVVDNMAKVFHRGTLLIILSILFIVCVVFLIIYSINFH